MTTLPRSRISGPRFATLREQRRLSLPAPSAAAVVHLFLLSGLLTAAVFAHGGTIPEAWLACEFAAGLLLVSWVVASKRATRPLAQSFPPAVVVLPLYATLQAVPLPLVLVGLLSPGRAELHQSIARWMPQIPSWTAVSVHPEATLDIAVRFAAYAAVYWIVRGVSARFARNCFAVAMPIVFVAAAQSAIALLQNLAGQPTTGSYVNRNHLAGLLEMALPFALVAVIPIVLALSFAPNVSLGRPRGEKRPALAAAVWSVLAGAAAVLIFVAILSTRSRGGLVATLVSLLVLGLAALYRSTLPRKKWLLAALLPALLAAAFVYLPSENLARRFTHLLGGEALRREGRVLLWSETLDLVAAYPLLGCGFGGFEPAFLRYKRSAPMVTDTHAHNDYLELLAEAGVIGFALCLLLAARPIAAAVRASLHGERGQESSLALACVGSLAAILVHSFVDFNLRIPANGMVFFWVLGLCSACGSSSGASALRACAQRSRTASEPRQKGYARFTTVGEQPGRP